MSEDLLTTSIVRVPVPEELQQRICSSGTSPSYENLKNLHDFVVNSLESVSIDPRAVLFSGHNLDSPKMPDEEEGIYFFGNESSLHPETQPEPDDPGVVVNPLLYALSGGVLGVYDMQKIAELHAQDLCRLAPDYPDNDFGVWAFMFSSPADLEHTKVAEFVFDGTK